MACKVLGTEHIINNTVFRLGDPEWIFLIDEYAQGKDGGLIDLVLVGEIDKVNLDDLGQKNRMLYRAEVQSISSHRDQILQRQQKTKRATNIVALEALVV